MVIIFATIGYIVNIFSPRSSCTNAEAEAEAELAKHT